MSDIYDALLDQQQAQPAAPAAPAIDIYDQILDGERQAAQRAMQPVLDMATKIQPERAASAQGLAKSTGLPVEIVERNFEEVQRREQIRNMQDILGRSPVLARQMMDPDFARLAHEDIEQLGALERITQGLKESGSSLVAGLYSGSAGVVGYAEAAAGLASRFTKPLAGTVLPADLGGLVQDSARDYRQSIQAYAKGWRPESSGILGKGWHAGLESFARNLPGIPLMLMPGGANAALLGMTLPVAGEEFGAARDKGLGLLESMIYGASQGALEYGTEKIPMSKLLGDLSKGSGFLKTLRRQVYAESWTEQVATLTQDLNQWAAIEINEGKTFGDYLAERPEAAAITAIATLVGTTGQTTIVHGMQKTLERVYGEAARAQLDVDIIERLAEAQRIVQSLQLTQINPASLEEYLQSLTEDSDISDLYIDASAIVDAGLVDQLSAVSPSVAEQIEQAVELGQQVRIPVEELLAQVAPSGVADALVDHLRTSPDGKTRAEAEEYLQRVSEEYRQQSAGVIQASAEQLAFDAELTAYGDQLVEQLDAIGGVHRHDHNVALASVHKGLVGALAQRAGMSPSDFIARYGVLRVSNEEEARSEDGTRATLEYLEKAYLDSHVDYERALSEGGDVDAAAAVRDAAKARLDAVRSGGIGSWQPPAELRPELAAMHLARRELDAARRAFDDASQAGAAELPIEAIRESSIKMAQAIDAAFGGELSIVADQFGGGKIELVRARDGTGWVVELRNEAGEVERDAVFTDRVSAIEAFLGDAVLAGMSFTYADSTGSQAAPAVSPIVAAREAAEAVAAELAAFDAAIDQGQEVDLGAQWDALDRQTEALRALQAELEALPDDGFALEAATPGGLVMSLTASAQQPGKWQLTRFDQAGEPWGDTQYETKGEAILEFLSDADVSTVRDFGGQLNQRVTSPTLADSAEKWAYKTTEYREQIESTGETIGNSGTFDPNEPNILYQRGSGRGSYLPSLNLVRLNNANLSTFIHETGHYGLEMLIAVASDISAKSADQITGSERGTLRDVNALMQWFGVRDINEWSMMSLEEKRGHHEQFAESFERYVMEGRAPSVELGGAFATMRRMMFSVYQTIKNMITSNPDAGALSDEVRQVFDRMIATDEQIEMQARVRSMLPLFESMDQANAIGATIEDWDQYQRDAEGAVDQAKAELAAAGVRDMKWLDGARSRALKRLQKHVASLREEAEMQARREVMTQPVYRAWQFLTGKVGEESQLPKPPKRKSDPNAVDPSIDSLFVAIAKLGGIDRAELESEWGLDPKERIAQAGFGKHVLRRNGGRGIDEMRTLLVQYGYLDPNEADPNEADPNWNPREFEERFFEELGGSLHYSSSADYAYLESLDMPPGQQALSPDQITAGRLDLDGLAAIGIPAEIVEHLKNLRMTARAGWHPDVLVETFDFGFDSGDALVRTIAAAPSLDDAIRARTDEIMLDRHSDLATPEGLKSAADEAVLSDLRAKVVASQLKALTRATGSELDLRRAARSVAAEIVARLKVRNVRPSIYSAAEARASKASAAALAKDDIETAAREQRNQLLSLYSAKEAYAALRDVDSAVKYLARFEGDAARKSISQDYLDQILEITSRFDLRKGVSLKEIDRVTSLQEWIEAQRDEGIEPDIPEWLKSGAKRTHYKNLTVAELRDVVDTIKHIEHLGRLKNRLLTARDNRTLAQVVSEIAASMEVASGGRVIDNQRRNELSSIITHGARGFMAMHRQLHSLVREMDGFADFGPFWQALVMPMNAAGDLEASMRADAAKRLHELAKPVLAEAGKMGGKGQLVPSLGRSLNRGERIAILLNWGNEGNTQRLLDGYGWRVEQLEPILNSFSRAELDFAQGVWDFFESYRPQIAAKERRVNGKEPEWIEPRSFTVQTKEGDTVTLRGGYYPVKYDVNQSGEAARNADADFADMARRAARVSSTTRRGYTKNRAEKVVGRPIVLSFDGIYSGANEVIHDLAWHEWLIDAGRLLRKLDPVIRNRYGAEYVTEITKLLGDIAQGDTPATNAFESTIQHLRNGATIAGLGWNLTTSLLQFTGFSNSVVRLGGVVDGSVWLARGLREFYGSPGHMMRKIEEAQGKSEFLRNRAMTMNRDINDIVNRLDKGKSDIRLKIEASFFVLIQKAQMMVDYPTWYAAYEKAMADPATVREDGTTDEALAISFADQMVVSAQAGGTTKDLARMQRGGPLLKLFTNFYSYFAATLQIAIERTKATDFRKPSNVAMLAGDYLLLMVIPAMLGMIIRAFMKGEDLDDDEWIDRIAAEQIGFIMGMTPITREMTLAVQALGGVGGRFDYAGPAGLRFFAELQKLGVQVSQGEFDMAAFKAANNTAGVLFHYPAGQVNRTVEGTAALLEGRTDNPLAVIAGPPPRN